MKNIFFLLFSASSAAVENKCDMDECVSCTIVNMRLEDYPAFSGYCQGVMYCCEEHFGERMNLVLGNVEDLKNKHLTQLMMQHLSKKLPKNVGKYEDVDEVIEIAYLDGKEVHRKMEKPVPPVYIKPENNGNFKFHGEVMYEDEL